MKKLFISLFVFLCCTAIIHIQAQDSGTDVLRTKKGVAVLPEVGDWAIGIDATPFFRYVGNIFANNPYAPSFGFTAQAPGAIFGKYKVTETVSYRGTLLFGITNETTKSPNATDPDQIDKTTTSALSIGLVGGIQVSRVVFGRLSGFYGAQAGIMKDPYDAGTYTGALSFKDGNDSDNDYKAVGGSTYGIMAGGFIGIEYFFAPRMALAGEFGYDLMFYTQGKRKYKPATGDEIVTDFGGNGIELTPNASGNLQLLFYF